MRIDKKQAGLTLVELMITVSLIGVLAAVAIPGFMSYQAKARRGEAFSNVRAIVTSEKTYQAERETLFEVGAFPNAALYGGLGTHTMPWDAASTTAFSELGWTPEGDVRYSYEVNTGGSGGCACTNCFTATANGDVDGNGVMSGVMYVQPQSVAGVLQECPSGLAGFGTPVRRGGTQKVYNEVAVYRGTDEF
jgi:prepilin-type N-terminal cleavage/methylation domain-containing protein